MQSPEMQNSKAPSPRKRFRVFGMLSLATGLLLALGIFLYVRQTDEPRVFSRETLPSDNRPAFVSTPRPTVDLGPLSNLPLRKNLFAGYLKLKMRIAPPKPNPAAYTFAPSADRRCSVHGLLSQCTQVTGTRYLIAREALGEPIYFGHSKALNGTQWVAAFERALQQDGYDLIRERSGVVKVIPQDLVAEYEKAGLIKRRR